MVKLKASIFRSLYIFFVLFFVCFSRGYSQNTEDYIRFVDSADNHIDTSSAIALSFLDSIPKPVEKYIEGSLANYYVIKGLIHDDYNEPAKVYQNYILAYKYAEKEEDYITAGEVCLELFANVYFAKRDSTAYKFLAQANKYFERANYKNGLVEIDQMDAYVKFIDGEFEVCNKLILDKLESYKAVRDNSYYEMFATYMLISSYIYLDKLDLARVYYSDFHKFNKDTTVARYNYQSFKTTIDVCFSEVFVKRKRLDSAKYYLSQSSNYRNFMGADTVEDYYGIYADFYKYSGNIEKSKAYLDSLRNFQDKMYNTIVDASFTVNEELLKAENELILSSEKKYFERFWIIIMLISLIIITTVFIVKNKKTKKEVSVYKTKTNEISNLQSNNEKLKLKVHSLEEYINDVKQEVKTISSLDEDEEQRNKIKRLYNDVNLNSNAILSKDESHLDLMKELNIGFFEKISSLFPKLNDSEIVICYYIFSGFKNKEIAVFLNCSIRAIEGKRYRISKKLKIKESNLILYDFLKVKLSHVK